MTVDAEYYILTDAATLKAFKDHMKAGEKNEVYKILKTNKDPRKAKKVDYVAAQFKADGESVSGMVVM
ncbi:hypothetical protein [Flavivirga jejuensis]|uniref:Uncharacterized protein n=1 Tax=Flavivirga jejuensis TaxID=870487 RepID=A0ABT8WNW7_9FLAO|nr:hypothetical protein [Flavivirga jejuensis]MDO5974851.1 hypothetical protein [Flavivirga jejuensis]